MRASRRLHDAMFNGVTRATMYFFNTNPSGRILNRFSKDMGQIDEYLPSVAVDVFQIFLSLLGIVIVVAIVNPYNLIPTFVIGVIFYFMREYYLLTSRNIKRVEAISEYCLDLVSFEWFLIAILIQLDHRFIPICRPPCRDSRRSVPSKRNEFSFASLTITRICTALRSTCSSRRPAPLASIWTCFA